MVPIRHKPGGLLGAVRQLRGSDGSGGINLEQVFAFPISRKRAVALIIIKREDWRKAYYALVREGLEPGQPEGPTHIEQQSNDVVLDRGFPTSRHMQEVVFNLQLEPGTAVTFECRGLSTWTPTWGSINGWIAEVRFNKVRLKIPTVLAWQITAIGWVGSVPLFGKWARRLLPGKVPGIAGLDDYKDERRWWIVSKDQGEATEPT